MQAAAFVMAEPFHPLLTADEFLVSETEKREGVTAFERLFNGSLEEMKQRWAALTGLLALC